MSLKAIPYRKPVPIALMKVSFAANLAAKWSDSGSTRPEKAYLWGRPCRLLSHRLHEAIAEKAP
jgi:hypothetical protein